MPMDSPHIAAQILSSTVEYDVVTAIENSFERATLFVSNGDPTATLTIRFYARPTRSFAGKGKWFKVGDDVQQEPSSDVCYVIADLFGDFKATGIASTTDITPVEAWLIYEAPLKADRHPRFVKGGKPGQS